MSSTGGDNFPPEILGDIFSYLRWEDYNIVSQVSQFWRAIAEDIMFERRYAIVNAMDHNNIKGIKVHCALRQSHMVPTQRIIRMSSYSDGAKFEPQTITEQAFSVRILLDSVTSPPLQKLTLLFSFARKVLPDGRRGIFISDKKPYVALVDIIHEVYRALGSSEELGHLNGLYELAFTAVSSDTFELKLVATSVLDWIRADEGDSGQHESVGNSSEEEEDSAEEASGDRGSGQEEGSVEAGFIEQEPDNS